MSQLLQLYYFRHGETEWSVSGQHTGPTDIPLTLHGEDQARMLATRLREMAFAKVLVSPRQRARRTCELAGVAALSSIEPDLSEWDYGEYEGRRTIDILKERPDWNIWRDGCPGGETPKDVADRAYRLLARLRELEGKIALFAHGQFGSVLAARWIGLPAGEGQHFALGPASMSILGHEPGHPSVPVIALWNLAPG